MTIGDRLEEWRIELNVTKKDLAAQLGIPLRSFARYASGQRSFAAEHFQRMAEMGCDVSWLITGRRSAMSHSPVANGIDDKLFKDVAAIVQRAHAAFGIDLPGPALLDMQIKRYNRVARVAPELRDGALAMLEQDLVDELADARANPGQGKRAG